MGHDAAPHQLERARPPCPTGCRRRLRNRRPRPGPAPCDTGRRPPAPASWRSCRSRPAPRTSCPRRVRPRPTTSPSTRRADRRARRRHRPECRRNPRAWPHRPAARCRPAWLFSRRVGLICRAIGMAASKSPSADLGRRWRLPAARGSPGRRPGRRVIPARPRRGSRSRTRPRCGRPDRPRRRHSAACPARGAAASGDQHKGEKRAGQGQWAWLSGWMSGEASRPDRAKAMQGGPDRGRPPRNWHHRSREASHVGIVRPVAALRRGPDDVLRRVLDVAGLAVDAVLEVDPEARIVCPPRPPPRRRPPGNSAARVRRISAG